MSSSSKVLTSFIPVALVCLATAGAYGEYVCGDANSDGALNVSDAVFIVNYVFVGGAAPDPGCCEGVSIGTVTDIDGNLYFTIRIGDQWWMAENLQVTHYRNGDSIPNVIDNGEWSSLTTGAYCYYDNDEGNFAIYGRLYNWYAAVDSRNIAPEGWHVPSDAEWKQLELYLGISPAEIDMQGWRGTNEGGKLKTNISHWFVPNIGATNITGFSALPGGYRFPSGSCSYMGDYASFWSTTEHNSTGAWSRGLAYYISGVDRAEYGSKRRGFSIRCVKD